MGHHYSLKIATLLGVLFSLSGSVLAAESTDDGDATPARDLPPLSGTHRPVLGNPPLPDGAPGRDTAGVIGLPESGDFTVVPRLPALTWYPCDKCHAVIPANTQRRELYVPHNSRVKHGGDQFWCHDCHTPEKKEQLHTLIGDTVDFNTSYQVCAQCHYQPRRDWFYGAHGKRAANWQGEREIYSCTHCHDPHNPAVRPRAPQPPPPLRRGLEPLHHTAQHTAPEPQSAASDTADEAQEP